MASQKKQKITETEPPDVTGSEGVLYLWYMKNSLRIIADSPAPWVVYPIVPLGQTMGQSQASQDPPTVLSLKEVLSMIDPSVMSISLDLSPWTLKAKFTWTTKKVRTEVVYEHENGKVIEFTFHMALEEVETLKEVV